MSAALYFYFWDDWTASPPAPAPSPPADPSPTDAGGGGKKKGRGRKVQADYRPPDPDFWDIREAYLRTLQGETAPITPPPAPTLEPPTPTLEPTPAPAPAPNYRLLPRFIAERSALIATLRLSTNLDQLRANGARLIEINRVIETAQRLQHEAELREAEIEARLRAQRRQERLSTLRQAGQLLLRALKYAKDLTPR